MPGHLETGFYKVALDAFTAAGVAVPKLSPRQERAIKMTMKGELLRLQTQLIEEYVERSLAARGVSTAMASVIVDEVASEAVLKSTIKGFSEADAPRTSDLPTSDSLMSDCVPAKELATLLHTALATIHKWKQEGKLLAVILETGKLLYPRWQVHDGRLLPSLTEILVLLRESGRSDRDLIRWFVNPNAQLGGESPLKILRDNQVRAVLGAAESLAERSR